MTEPSVPSPFNPRRISFLKFLSRAAGATAVVGGSLVLVGWGFDHAVLKSVFPGAVTMKANTALAFVLAGMSLWMLGTDQAGLQRRRTAAACAALVALIGSLTFAEYLFGWNLGIDQLLFQESSDAAGTSHPGRMAPTTALNFILIGVALALLDTARGFRAVQLLVVLAGFIGLLGVIGYLYRVKAFYGIASYTEMALHTAAAFAVLSVSILCARPDRGLMALAASDTAGGIMTRRLLPFVIGIPLVLGWARLTAERAGFFSTEFGVALFAVSLVVLFASLIMWIAGLLHRIDNKRKAAEAALRNAYAELEQRVEERTAELHLVIEKMKLEIAERKRAEEALRESEERFRLIMEHANDAITYLDLAGIVQWTNHQAVAISGRPMEAMVGRSFMAILAPEAAARAEVRLDAIRRGESVPPLVEFEVLRPDGSAMWVEANITSVLEGEKVVGRLLVARDITARKRAEDTLRESERRMRAILAGALDAVVGMDVQGIITYWNPRSEAIFGWTRSEAIGRKMSDMLIPPQHREAHELGMQHFLATGSGPVLNRRIEITALRRDGTEFPVEIAISAHKSDDSYRFTAFIADITERKRAEEALRESKTRFKSAFDFAAIGMALVAPDGQWLQVNRALCEIVGYSEQEMLATTFQAITHPDDLETDLAYVRQMLTGEIRTYQMEKRYFHKLGHIVWVLLSVSLVWDTQGKPLYFIPQIQDITERRQAEEALRESEERFRLIMEHVNDAIIYLDLAGIVRWANHQAVEISGRSMEAMAGHSFITVLGPEAAARTEARLVAIRQGKSVSPLVEFEVPRLDGSVVWMEAHITRVREDGKVVGRLLVARDISERKRAEEALRESEQQLRQLFEDRERISRDLHDNIIQTLYAIGMGLEECRRLIKKNSATAVRMVGSAVKGLNAVIRDVRTYIAGREPQILSGQQLRAELTKLVQTMEAPHLLRFRLSVDPTAAARLTSEDANHVLYIVREAMSNSLRHSHAKTGGVSLRLLNGNVRLEVADDGAGFDMHQKIEHGEGLHNMTARAQELGARLEVIAQHGQGTRVILDIPGARPPLP